MALCGPESAVPYLFGFVQLRESEALTRFQSIRSDCSTGQEKMQVPSVFVALASDREVKGKQPGRAYSETVTVTSARISWTSLLHVAPSRRPVPGWLGFKLQPCGVSCDEHAAEEGPFEATQISNVASRRTAARGACMYGT